MREYLCAVIPALQPAVLQQGRGASVEFVGAVFDVGEDVGDPGQLLQVVAAACQRGRRVCPAVRTTRRRCGRPAFRRGHFRFRVGVDGEVAVRAEVPGQEIADPAGASAGSASGPRQSPALIS